MVTAALESTLAPEGRGHCTDVAGARFTRGVQYDHDRVERSGGKPLIQGVGGVGAALSIRSR
jgi:hypothetical protein